MLTKLIKLLIITIKQIHKSIRILSRGKYRDQWPRKMKENKFRIATSRETLTDNKEGDMNE